MSDDLFLTAFETCVIPRADWTHDAHVRMAWLYLTRQPFAEALVRIRVGIQRYNASLGRTTGYHDTITVAYSRLIESRLVPGEDFAAFRNRNPELLDRTMAVLKRHYSEERLTSDTARTHFTEPDLAPLPTHRG